MSETDCVKKAEHEENSEVVKYVIRVSGDRFMKDESAQAHARAVACGEVMDEFDRLAYERTIFVRETSRSASPISDFDDNEYEVLVQL
jgi:hypothetical protein